MNSLSDKLKSLGVKVGASDLQPPNPRIRQRIEDVIPGQFLPTIHGETFIIKKQYDLFYFHGNTQINPSSISLDQLSDWVGNKYLSDIPPSAVCFLDTETTGLSGGTGTLVFLVGIGNYIEECFLLSQYLLHDPAEELAFLIALEQYLASFQVLVTFNGKSFDLPLLRTRFLLHGFSDPFSHLQHIDLLHLSRRLWRDRLHPLSLVNLEYQILRILRTEDDIPGWKIPQIYFDYLRERDPVPLINVLYHNSMDVISMVALLKVSSMLLKDPISLGFLSENDLLSIAKFHEYLGHHDIAINLYTHNLNKLEMEGEKFHQSFDQYLETNMQLAQLYKKKLDYSSATQLWKKAVEMNSIQACIELAKFFEHKEKDFDEAATWTLKGLQIALSDLKHQVEKDFLISELNHRLERIERKLNSSRCG